MMNTMRSEISQPTKKPSRINGILIPAVIIVPMVLAYVMFYTGWGVPLLTTNNGEFLSPPQQVTTLDLLNNDSTLVKTYEEGSQKRWRILLPITADCLAACSDNLYLTRQVHIRLAQKAYRVERILVLLDSFTEAQLAQLKQDHPTTLMVNSNQAAFTDWLSAAGISGEKALEQYYLIDQEGYAMMQYDNTHSGQDLLDDVKKLLKFTYDK